MNEEKIKALKEEKLSGRDIMIELMNLLIERFIHDQHYNYDYGMFTGIRRNKRNEDSSCPIGTSAGRCNRT